MSSPEEGLKRRVRELEDRVKAAESERRRTRDQVEQLFRVSAAILATSELEEQLRLVAGGIVSQRDDEFVVVLEAIGDRSISAVATPDLDESSSLTHAYLSYFCWLVILARYSGAFPGVISGADRDAGARFFAPPPLHFL